MESATLPRVKYADLSDRRLAYAFSQLALTGPEGDILIAFVNGLGLPQAFWQPVVDLVQQRIRTESSTLHRTISLFTYDRNGQGLSRSAETPVPNSHDMQSAALELDSMINHVKTIHLPESSEPKIFLVAHSIGVPLARLYCHQYPETTTALLALDSNITNTDFVSLMPDPDSPDFNASQDLLADTTVEQLRWTRENYRKMFHPSAPNPENLYRSNLANLLPLPDSPVLKAPGGSPLFLTVVGHDPIAFAEESLRISTKGLTEHCLQPAWDVYNEGLLQIGDTVKGVVIADGSGHFVQRDNPKCIADEIMELLVRIGNRD